LTSEYVCVAARFPIVRLHRILTCVSVWSERGVISAESFYHPLRRVWHGQDGAETTVMHGEWTTSHRSECTFQRRRQLVHVIRSVSAYVGYSLAHVITAAIAIKETASYSLCIRDTMLATNQYYYY